MRAAQGRASRTTKESRSHAVVALQVPRTLAALAALAAAAALALALPRLARAQDAVPVSNAAEVSVEPYTLEELDNLLAPVALYPDPILAQVLVAASYPEQVELAARHVRLYGTDGIDDQPWHISVRAVARYQPVLNLLADRIDWTTALGQAHATQADDVMTSVQSLRRMARAQGNLVTTKEQEVLVEDDRIYIQPAQPRVIYVPTYDPVVIYHRPVVHHHVYRSGWSFGIAFPIGVWLTYDVDWHNHHVYYHGWSHYRHAHHHHGWHYRSRPFIVVNNIYVNPRHTTVIINRRVVNRRVHYDRLGGYNTVHRRVTWDRRRQYEERRYAGRRDDGPSWDRNRRVSPDRYDRPGRGNDGKYDRPDRDNRAPTTRAEAARRVAAATPTAPRNDGRRIYPTRTNPERVTSDRTAGRTYPQRTTTQRTDAPRTQPQRSYPQRSAPQRVDGARTQPQRSAPQRTQPQRSSPQRTQPSRAEPQRSAPRMERAPTTRREAVGAVTRSQPRAQPKGEGRGQARRRN